MGHDRFRSFVVTFKETDLWIGISGGRDVHRIPGFVLDQIKELRWLLYEYGEKDDVFFSALMPYTPKVTPPALIERMFSYGRKADVGPMASVAGLFAQEIGERMMGEFGVDECVVENGGDVYMDIDEPASVSIFAGSSPFSNLAVLEVDPVYSPLGICTSSGTVGHSYSSGCADAVTIACHEAGLADAFATAFGNKVKRREDIDRILEETGKEPEILHALAIIDDRLGLRGSFALRASDH
jgi:ApbE superfamily uncharacterized protein (UPF0280 family)